MCYNAQLVARVKYAKGARANEHPHAKEDAMTPPPPPSNDDSFQIGEFIDLKHLQIWVPDIFTCSARCGAACAEHERRDREAPRGLVQG
jgi:hypothetical protein